MTSRILIIPGSNRTGSFNVALAKAVAVELAQQGADVTRISLADYPLPIVDQDLKEAEGIPENAMKLGRLINAHDGVALCCPEYNSSITPLMKNMIDWVSLIASDNGKPLKPWAGKTVSLFSASNGKFAGIRGLYHVRSVMMNVGAQIPTEQCSVGGAADAFDETGHLKDERTHGMLQSACKALLEMAEMRSPRA